ncbi:hypothetical protein CTI14_19920, partial [Methylobacterium radiotolerans]
RICFALISDRHISFQSMMKLKKYSSMRVGVRLKAHQPVKELVVHTFGSSSSKPSPTTFDNIVDIIKFDDQLNSILFRGLRVIELWMKSVMTNDVTKRFEHPAWYAEPDLLRPDIRPSHFLPVNDEVKKILEYASGRQIKAHQPVKDWLSTRSEAVPLMILGEEAGFKFWGYLYRLLDEPQKVDISMRANLTPETLLSWLRFLGDLRNSCAHHDILWNRVYMKAMQPQPKIARALQERSFTKERTDGKELIARRIYLIYHVLHYIGAEGNEWLAELKALLIQAPNLRTMGFQPDWAEEPEWNLY